MIYYGGVNNRIRDKLFENYFIKEDKISIAIMSEENTLDIAEVKGLIVRAIKNAYIFNK